MIRVFIQDNSVTTGKGKTGLTYLSTNLQISVIRELSATPTIYTGANIEDITTIGTFQAPSLSSKCRFKAINETNRPGEYEIHFHDDAGHFGNQDASKNVSIRVDEITTTALNIAPCLREVELVAYDPQDVTALGTGLALESGGNLASVLNIVDALRINKNTALNNFSFLMVDSTDHVTPKTGLTVTAERSIDGAAFAACANAVAEVGNGVYKINLAASDLNGDVITLKFTAVGADQRTITIVTQA
jgi:hypothetical protein